MEGQTIKLEGDFDRRTDQKLKYCFEKIVEVKHDNIMIPTMKLQDDDYKVQVCEKEDKNDEDHE